jgi:NhaP-type Na+/H+ or K+/H+ antiporter
VLAGEVQVGEPDDPDEPEDEARFSLTSEAGLNDALAFPFVYAAIAISVAGADPGGWLADWLLVDVAWRIAVGTLVGLAAGWLLSRLFFNSRLERARLADQAEGFVALAPRCSRTGSRSCARATASWPSSCAPAHCGPRSAATSTTASCTTGSSSWSGWLTVAILVLFGGAVPAGCSRTWASPRWRWPRSSCCWCARSAARSACARAGTGPRERWAVAFFGVRGIGSLYYAAYGIEEGTFDDPEQIWSVVGLVVLGSVILHGVLATPVMDRLDRLRVRAGGDKARTTAV